MSKVKDEDIQKELSHQELLMLLGAWRKQIKVGDLHSDQLDLQAYFILTIDELFRRFNAISKMLDELIASLPKN